MPKTSTTIRKAVSTVGEKVTELAWTVGRDPREERREKRRWSLLETTVSAAFALVARRLAFRAWDVLTGEAPPIAGAGRKQNGDEARPGSTASEDAGASADRAAEPKPQPPGATSR